MKAGQGTGRALAWVPWALLIATGAAAADIETAVRETYATNEGMLTDATTAAVAELFLGFHLPDGASLLVEPASDHRANWFVETYLLAYLSEGGYQAYLAFPSGGPDYEFQEPAPAGSPPSEPLAEDTPAKPTEATSPPAPGSLAEAMAGTRQTPAEETPAGESAPDSVSGNPEAEPAAGTGGEVSVPPSPPRRQPLPPVVSRSEAPEYVLRYRTVLCELSYPRKFRTSPLGSRKVQRRASVSIVAQMLRGAREDVVWVGKGNVERVNYVPAGKLDLLAGSNFPFNPPALESKSMGSYVEPVLVTGIVAGLIYLFYANQD